MRGDDERQRFLDRCFEFLKHMTTLSTAALLILAIYRAEPFQAILLAITLILLALCVVISIYAMQVIALESREPRLGVPRMTNETHDAIVEQLTYLSGTLFTGAVVSFALLLFEVQFWRSLAVLGTLLLILVVVALLQRRRHKRRSSL